VSRENADLVRRATEEYLRRGLGAVIDSWDPEIELHDAPGFPGPPVYSGPQAVDRRLRDFIQSFEDFAVEIEDVLDVGDKVVVMVHQHGRPRGGAGKVAQRIGWVVTVRDRKVVRMEIHASSAGAMRAAGVTPSEAGD
jgi:ketosteroid isomerase-like protein